MNGKITYRGYRGCVIKQIKYRGCVIKQIERRPRLYEWYDPERYDVDYPSTERGPVVTGGGHATSEDDAKQQVDEWIDRRFRNDVDTLLCMIESVPKTGVSRLPKFLLEAHDIMRKEWYDDAT